ncbi:type II toxin-antitoxin system RelE/ParE family toxin [Chryseobacterium indoltheticum]|uniref:type II toxin-antitoxin system RelE/ParE family toxin n=1 Tax=Chryseobacterium indoltheticum TaxID=254 RepID=UPI0019120C7C|nr:type II toxin-antitoxin system RelE/ParE family toxin [Chryseobacterium indoltheticum]QQQ27302.1 type II toxin-antitoxin system RelE/ParE family toxin [Chryseobacterium indoltheticum]
MIFEIFQYPEADQDILAAVNYYKEISNSTASNFEKELSKAYDQLERNPFFQIRYDDVRVLPLKKFPYIILFHIDEIKKIVFVISVFCTHQNPEKYP